MSIISSWLIPTGYPGSNYLQRPVQIEIEGKVINYVEVSTRYTLAVTDDGLVIFPAGNIINL